MFPIVQYPDDREGVVCLLPGVKYKIETFTGRHLMAGCNSVVSIRLVGTNVSYVFWLIFYRINRISRNELSQLEAAGNSQLVKTSKPLYMKDIKDFVI